MLTLILTILGNLVPAILQSRGVIGASTDTLITKLTGVGAQLLTTITTKPASIGDAMLLALATISGVIEALKATTNLPQEMLTLIADIDGDVQAAFAGYATGGLKWDANLYQQIGEVS